MGKPTRLLWLAVLFGGCASGPSTPINTVARGDLACDQVNVSEVADNRYQAVGCGKTGTYAKLCSGRHCSWVRVRSPSEQQQSSGGYAAATGTYGQRQIVPAPPPEQREVIQAPPPAQPQPREIIQAPPPEQAAAPVAQPDAAQQAYTPQPTPLSQGDLSQPYQTEVPLEASTQRVQYPPPAPLVEERPLPPQPNYTWIGGYWWWGNPAWTWVPGYWCAPRFGYSYVASSWYWNSGYWWFGPGGWARPGSTLIVSNVGPRPTRYVTSRSFTPHYVASGGGRIGTGPGFATSPARAPSRYTPQASPLYQYPTSSSQRAGRMGVMGAGPARSGGYNGLSSSPGPSRFGAGSPATSSRNYGYQPGRMGGGASRPSRMDVSPSSPSMPSSNFRSAPMMRMPSSPGPSRMGGGGGSFNRGGGGGVGRMGGGGGGGFNRGGGGGVGRMGGGGGGRR